ncbi:transcription antitermination factor NusB [Pisciglobus halotolerans]|uniref:Transcription antitermination protein NusB n=1 Tax=Pisciglobus halotolerans TaxID=745365 RepID=A0A1I3CWC0_9LACT|nr:transcription antitermination factor NusB [Pisciglobus halotolerans]SFH78733.1 NusB antitermination factor [Pisciglobus halotolerans]
MRLTRREVREKALQSLFQLSTNDELTKEEAMIQALESDHDEEEVEKSGIPVYLNTLVSGVIEHEEQIDQKIKQHLENWSISRLAKTDLAIMRIAVFEMLYVQDVPDRVALNEALEITKRYSDDRSRKFVNGVLANIVKDEKEA